MNTEQLRAAFVGLEPVATSADRPWRNNLAALRREVASGDAERFLTWPTVVATMFVGAQAACIPGEFAELRRRADWPLWEKAVAGLSIGAPERCAVAQRLQSNLIHQAIVLHHWMDGCERTPNDLHQMRRIIEIGAGYGAMALVIRRLGFQNAYHIKDFPDFELLQQHFLGEARVPARWSEPSEPADLLIACWSISEAPPAERERLLSYGAPKSYLIAYQDAWEDIDNHAWFAAWAARRPQYHWRSAAHPHIPGHYYLWGDLATTRTT